MSALAKALVAAQAEFPVIERSREVRVQTKTGGHYTFAYAPLEDIRARIEPVLAKHGLSYSQLLGNIEGRPALRTVLLHEDGEQLEDSFPLPANGGQTAQEYGSLITYFRRYALVALLGLATEEDDDGNSASGNQPGGASPSAKDTSSGGTAPSSAPPENPAEDARRAAMLAAIERATRPSDLPVHWGRLKGTPLGELKPEQLRWMAEDWKVQDNPSPYDLRLKAAAVRLLAGDDEPLTDEVLPFA